MINNNRVYDHQSQLKMYIYIYIYTYNMITTCVGRKSSASGNTGYQKLVRRINSVVGVLNQMRSHFTMEV
jgi:hypothetical protein